MLDEKLEKLSATVDVLEHLMVMLLALRYQNMATLEKPALAAAIEELARFRQSFSEVTFPGQEPALADLRAGETVAAVERIFSRVEGHLARVAALAFRLGLEKELQAREDQA